MTAASTHLEVWDKLARPDQKALKPFQRSGGFKGTAINPMYTLHSVTEAFGPCGKGWGMTQPEFQVVGSNVYCTVGVTYDGCKQPVWGVGGEALTGRGDDEAFKKAYTDALGNALKHLGANADIYFNLWDGNKYVDEKQEPPPVMPSANGTKGASKAGNRDTYAKMVAAIRNAPTVKALGDWYKSNVTEIDALPADWLDELRVEYADRKAELEKGLAA